MQLCFPTIQGSRELVVSSDGNLIEGEPLKRVQGALLILLGYLDRNRNGEEEEKLQQGELPSPVTMLIYDLRRPTIFNEDIMACSGYARRREWIKKWTKIAYERATGKR